MHSHSHKVRYGSIASHLSRSHGPPSVGSRHPTRQRLRDRVAKVTSPPLPRGPGSGEFIDEPDGVILSSDYVLATTDQPTDGPGGCRRESCGQQHTAGTGRLRAAVSRIRLCHAASHHPAGHYSERRGACGSLSR